MLSYVGIKQSKHAFFKHSASIPYVIGSRHKAAVLRILSVFITVIITLANEVGDYPRDDDP